MAKTLEQLFLTLPQIGRVEWLGLRPERRAPMEVVDCVQASSESGLIGDRYSGSSGKRQVTLIQYEHLAVIASLLGRDMVSPVLLRRNIAVSGINLLALKGKQFSIGDAVLEHTGLCHPCSFMETTFDDGGYNAVRGHGGITARVIKAGKICVSNEVSMITTI